MESEGPRSTQQAKTASTQDVLGRDVGESNVDPKWEEFYRMLSEQRDAILARRRDLVSQAAEASTPLQRNLAERGTDEFDRDLALGAASSEQELLYEIEQALNRIRQGTYGSCEMTGKPIEPERLKAIPWTRFSGEAEHQLESEGQAIRPRIGGHEQT